jgi:hypothetical protein
MEKDNKSVPMRVFSNTMSNYSIDTKTVNASTSILQNMPVLHTIHPRLNDIQMCTNEIIDLTAVHGAPTAVALVNVVTAPPTSLSSQQAYELANMMSVYDVNNSNFGEISSVGGNLDILKGISKGMLTKMLQ